MFSVFKLLYILLSISFFFKYLSFAQDKDQFIFHGFSGSNLMTDGIAKIHASGLLELTNLSSQEVGHAFYPFPFEFNKSSSEYAESLAFSTNFAFAIYPQAPNLGGHGLAFTIAPTMDFTKAWGTEYLGLFNSSTNGLSSNHIVAVELDTVRTLNFEDINNNHVGIDVNNLTSEASASAAYFSDNEYKNLTLMSGKIMQVWVDYDDLKSVLNVTLAPITSTKPEKPLLSTPIDLSAVFFNSMYVGFSSSTGTMSSYHFILGWSFNKSGPAQALDASKLPSIDTSKLPSLDVPPRPSVPPPPPPPPPPRKSGNKPDIRVIVPSVTASVALITIFGALYIRRKKYEELREDWEQEYGPQRFSYRDLYKATKGFKDMYLLGCGGFGKVYRGVLPSSHTEVAVKKFSHESQQGMKEFIAEIVSMGRLRHRNLVQLLGYCRRKGELLLVYEYMQNGSLDSFLFEDDTPNLNWVQRYQILKGVVSALLYLHEGWEQVVIHRDVKASNVMLDAELNGRLGDFGLAKFHDRGSIPQTTAVVGTIGYLAPEVSRTGRVTTSSDVFAFGTLMLEVASGRRAVEPHRPPAEVILVDWILEYWKRGAVLDTSDPKLEGKYMALEMELVLKLGLLCAHPTPAIRPTMRQVMQYLDGKATLPDIPLDNITPYMAVVIENKDASQDCSSSSPVSNEYSGLSISTSVLKFGR